MTGRFTVVVRPVTEPITGREELGDLSRPEQALAQFYRALNGRDLVLLADNWEQSDEVVMDNPVGGVARGWEAIRAVYARLFAGSARLSVEFHDYTIHGSDSIFYAVGRERGRFERRPIALDLVIRTTRIFCRTNGRWRQVHHHGSIEDPALLGAYQQAVSPAAR
jgi:ketosteroid isomerase-like protein